MNITVTNSKLTYEELCKKNYCGSPGDYYAGLVSQNRSIYNHAGPAEFAIVELRVLAYHFTDKYPAIRALAPTFDYKCIISALLSISINRNVSLSLAGTIERLAYREDDPISLVWSIVESAFGEGMFNALDFSRIDYELHLLLCELDRFISALLPPHWGCCEFTFYEWLGETTIVLLKDG